MTSTEHIDPIPDHRWWKAEVVDGWAVIRWTKRESDEREVRYRIREMLKR